MTNRVALVIFAISSVCSFHLPPVDIGVPQKGDGKFACTIIVFIQPTPKAKVCSVD